MEKKNNLGLICLSILTIVVIGICIYALIDKEEKNQELNNNPTDAILFKEEYEKLNGETSHSGNLYPDVIINEKNTIKYVTEEEAISLLKDDSGVIYFGFPTCPWCRNLVPLLTEVAKNSKETIYYLNILDIRSSFELENGKVKKIKDGSEGYYKILKLLDQELEDFVLEDEAGNKVKTKEKRLYAPTLVAFKKGKITSIHVGTVDSQKSPYENLKDEEKVELEKIIKDLIASKNKEACSKDKC